MQAIETTGSISAAARAMGMSYRRAWLLVESLNKSFRAPLVETLTGGGGGGGARLSVPGKEVLKRYRAMEAKAARAVAADLRSFSRLFVKRR